MNSATRRHYTRVEATLGDAEHREAIRDEVDLHGDIELLGFRDIYTDKTFKMVALMRYGVERIRAKYIIEHEDDYCVRISTLQDVLKEHESEGAQRDELYGGTLMFRGNEYEELMKGADGKITPFMSGHCVVLSRGLVRYILDVDWKHTVLFANYGTSSDDANVGRWVRHAVETHGLRVHYRYRPMVDDIENTQKNESSHQ